MNEKETARESESSPSASPSSVGRPISPVAPPIDTAPLHASPAASSSALDSATPSDSSPLAPPAPPPPPALCVKGLCKKYGEMWAVDHLSFEIQRGEVYGLLGPNGAGKTTTLRMLAGLLHPTEGTMLLLGLDPISQSLEVKRALGFLTGSTGLYQRLTTIEILRFFGDLQEMPRPRLEARIEALVTMLGMGDFAKKPCGSLSTGQKQRVNLARALLHEPAILILDEPTSGLDLISADFILHAIEGLRKAGHSVLFSTHILAETELLCDRIGILFRGKKIEEGSPKQLQEKTGTTSMASAFLTLIKNAS